MSNGRRTGRPSQLMDPVELADGRQVPAADHIVQLVRTVWLPWESLAASVGVSRQCLHNWRRRGGQARAKAASGAELTEEEAAYQAFVDSLERAEAEAVMLRFGGIQREAQGGYTLTETTEEWSTNAEGTEVLVKRTVKTSTARPVWTAFAWQLERRLPDMFGRKDRLEHSGPAGGPIEVGAPDQVHNLAESLQAYQQGLADAKEAREAEANG